jgi:putative oxidoreductase
MIMFGLFTRLALFPLITTMSIALFMVNWGKGWEKMELAGLFLAVYVLLLFVGPGKYSADAAMGR